MQEAVEVVDARGVREVLVDDEVVVTLDGVTIDHTVLVTIFGDLVLQVDRSVGQHLHREHHVLDQARGSRLAHRTHRGEYARTHLPILRVLLGFVREFDRGSQLLGVDQSVDSLDVSVELSLVAGGGFDQQGGAVLGQCVDKGGNTLHMFDRADCQTVQQLDTTHGRALQLLNGLARRAHIVEVEHCAGLAGHRFEGREAHQIDECQRTLRADHQVGDHIERIGVIDQRIQTQTRRIFDTVFLMYTSRKCLVVSHTAANLLQTCEELGVRTAELVAAGGVARIEHRTVGQHDTHRVDRFVAILVGSVHTAGVVGDDTADHCRAHRCGVGTELTTIGSQQLIDSCADDTGLNLNVFARRVDLDALPIFARQHQHRVGRRLTRECRTCRAEGHGNIVAGCSGHDLLDLLGRGGAHDKLRNKTIETCVGAQGEQTQWVGDQTFAIETATS